MTVSILTGIMAATAAWILPRMERKAFEAAFPEDVANERMFEAWKTGRQKLRNKLRPHLDAQRATDREVCNLIHDSLRLVAAHLRKQYPDATDVAVARVAHASVRSAYGSLADSLFIETYRRHPLPPATLEAP